MLPEPGTLELDALQLDALQLDALQLDALQLDALHPHARVALRVHPCQQQDGREHGDLERDGGKAPWLPGQQ